jgi:hypothetical protein
LNVRADEDLWIELAFYPNRPSMMKIIRQLRHDTEFKAIAGRLNQLVSKRIHGCQGAIGSQPPSRDLTRVRGNQQIVRADPAAANAPRPAGALQRAPNRCAASGAIMKNISTASSSGEIAMPIIATRSNLRFM